MKISKLFHEFFESEKSGGILLIFCTIFSLAITNSDWSGYYLNIWHWQWAGHSLAHWINDGLMAIFFLLIGLELEREIYKGELSNPRKALLPAFAAVGGMLFPASIYMLFNWGTYTQSGTGIPTATDIAFALGILSLLGNRVPFSLKIFLTALAVIDDLGAVIIIAIFYTKTVFWYYLAMAMAVFGLLLLLNRLKVRSLIPYLVGGGFMWYFMLNSGVHATISGVLLAFAIPFGKGDSSSPSYILQHHLHKPVAFAILPLFALANTAISFNIDFSQLLSEPYTPGIALGLIVGKPLGIFLMSWLAVYLGWCKWPENVNGNIVIATGFLGGIGFTMSIFVTLLAFDNDSVINNAKLVILFSSLVSGLVGYFYLNKVLK